MVRKGRRERELRLRRRKGVKGEQRKIGRGGRSEAVRALRSE